MPLPELSLVHSVSSPLQSSNREFEGRGLGEVSAAAVNFSYVEYKKSSLVTSSLLFTVYLIYGDFVQIEESLEKYQILNSGIYIRNNSTYGFFGGYSINQYQKTKELGGF